MISLAFIVLKTVHVVSSTILFGTGLGTAFHMWMTHLRGDVAAIASTARNVVVADWLFTSTTGVLQPLTGIMLVVIAGYDPVSSWLVLTYCLYMVAGLCWLVVVCLQIRVARIAARCATESAPLPADYHRAMRAWFCLGWPAFLALIGVFWLMVSKPDLW
jgi:uncharacterized membrane protein